jgi:hypothetical protein
MAVTLEAIPTDAGMLADASRPRPRAVRRRGTMELAEAFDRLRRGDGGAAARAAVAVIRNRALRRARRRARALADDCAQEVTTRLWTVLATGRDPVRNPGSGPRGAYIDRMVDNWLNDRHRKERRRRQQTSHLALLSPMHAPAPSLEAEEERDLAHVRTLLCAIADYARAARPARARGHFDQGWREVQALVFEKRSLRQILEQEEELAGGASATDVRRERNRAYTRHRRTRNALAAAVDEMAAAGRLSPEDSEVARLAVYHLVRRGRGDGEAKGK